MIHRRIRNEEDIFEEPIVVEDPNARKICPGHDQRELMPRKSFLIIKRFMNIIIYVIL